jgi:chitinase
VSVGSPLLSLLLLDLADNYSRVMLLIALLVSLSWLPWATADTYCSATVPCAIGCCGTYNVCGLGPDYCSADNCINNCDAKAECNPGDWPSEYVNATTCPLNVCCSKYGFCGTTEEFCGDSTVTRPSCDVASQSIKRVIGYYASGGASRSCDGMIPQSFPQGVYSHVYFAFGSIDPDTFEVIPASSGDEALYPQLQALQTRDLGQELWLSIGGWDFTDSDSPTATTFSDLAAADITYQNVFFASLTLFMSTWGFTGVDIDWEYPAADDRNGRAEDYGNYPTFLANLKAALSEYKYGLSITLPTSYWYLQHFDLVSIEPSVDWFNYMSYDLHGTWDIGNEWTGAYLDAHTNLTEIESALDLLWRNNITSSKVNLGMAFYGRSFTIASSACSEPGCLYLSAGDAGDCSATAGILLNSEIEQIISEYDLSPMLYEDAAVKTITWNGDQWVSFDDEDTWKIKADFAKSQCLGGVLVWSVDYDDGNNTFSDGLAAALGNEINVDSSTGLTLQLSEASTDSSQDTQNQYCRFTNCGETCPNGFTSIVRADDKSQLMLDSTECPPGSGQTQTLCCPTSTDVPTCQWRGFHNNGKCKGGCNSNEAEVGTISAGCSSGYQSACCTITTSTTPWSDCQWTSSCESDDTCPSGYSNYVVGSRDGWGGRPSCSGSKTYNYCCSGSVPDAFTSCDWVGHEVTFTNTAYCSDTCPSGSVRIAEQSIVTIWGNDKTAHTADCYYGNEAYCCSGPDTSSTVSPRGTDPFIYQDETAQEFDAYLQKFLESPICPGGWDAQYSAYVSLAGRELLLEERATDETITLTFLLPILSTWITSQYPRSDLTEIWNYRLNEYGYGSDGANASIMTDSLYEDSWSGSPIYSPNTMISDVLCNIAESANGLNNLDAASSALCEDVDVSSTTKRELLEISPRRLSEVNMNDRTDNNVEPTIAYALRGVLDVCCFQTPHLFENPVTNSRCFRVI